MNVLFNKWFAGGLIVLIVLSGAILYPKDFKQMLSDNPNAKYVVTFDVLSQQGNVISPDAKAGYLRWKFSKSEYDSYYWGSLKEMDATWAVEYKNSSGIWIELPRKSSTVKLNYSENVDSVSIIKEWGIYKYVSKSGTAGLLVENISVFPGRVKFSAKFAPADSRDYRLVWKFKGIANHGDANISKTDYWFSSQYPSKHKGWYANTVHIDEPEKLDFVRGTNVSADFVMKENVLDIDPTVQLQVANTEMLEDTYIDSASPGTNFGSSDMLAVKCNYFSAGGYLAAFKFNMTNQAGGWIDSSSGVSSARLSLYINASSDSRLTTYFNQTWVEEYPTYNTLFCGSESLPGGFISCMITRNSQCNGTSGAAAMWSDPGTEGSTTIIGWNNFTVTQAVVNASLENNRNVSFVMEEASSGVRLGIVSKENADTAKRPYLNITYNPADTQAPKFSLNRTNFTAHLNYSLAGYQFNTSWEDETALSKIFIEHNLTGSLANYSVTTNQEAEYYYNFGPIGVGGFVWRYMANDTSNNWNATANHFFQIYKAVPILTMSNTTNSVNTSGMVLYMPFSEGSGASITEDKSGWGNNGTLTNMNITGNSTSGWTAGKYGSGLMFDGVNDYVGAGNMNNANISKNITVSAWFFSNAYSVTGDTLLLHKGRWANFAGFGIITTITPTIIIRIANLTATGFFDTPPISVNKFQWYQVAFATREVNETASNILVYLNATLMTNSTAEVNISTANGFILNIGVHTSYTRYFNGTIDEVRIYNRSLSADEIKMQYNSSKYYPFTSNVSASISNSEQTLSLYRYENTSISGLNDTIRLAAGSHWYIANASASQNYTKIETLLPFEIMKNIAQNATLMLNNSLANASYYHDQVWNMTGNCSNTEQKVGLYLNATGFGNNFTSGTGAAYNTSRADLYFSDDNYNATAVCFDNGNYSQKSDSSYINILSGIDFYLNASLIWKPSSSTQYNMEPTNQTANKSAVCVNNTRAGTQMNISFYTVVNLTSLYNITLFGNPVYNVSAAERIGMERNESWIFNNTPANVPKCLYLWANLSNGKVGRWTPDLYADVKLS